MSAMDISPDSSHILAADRPGPSRSPPTSAISPISGLPPRTDEIISLYPLHFRSPQPKLPIPNPSQVLALLAPFSNKSSRDPSPSGARSPRKTPHPMSPPGGMMVGAEGASGTPPTAGNPDSGRALNVTDALSYLDAVKMQFQDKPDVYNHFLDIMKDFKSQVIDTPGVIQRVSMLFHGNPYLIQGFNTFLPPGYRIELSTDHLDTITVTTPMGQVTQSTAFYGAPPRLLRESVLPGGMMGSFTQQQPPFGLPPPPVLPIGIGSGSRPVTPLPAHFAHGQSPFIDAPPPHSPAMQGAQTTAAASFLGNLGSRTVEKKEEFNHAIQFLNKIKTRYAEDQETYKQFLEILQTYQKEQRQLQDALKAVPGVCASADALQGRARLDDRVQGLLTDRFRTTPPHTGLVGILPQPVGAAGASGSYAAVEAPVDKVTKPQSRRRKRPEKDTSGAQKNGAGRINKRAKANQKPEPQSPKRTYPNTLHRLILCGLLVPSQAALPQAYKTSFCFRSYKKALESGGTYEEFLKLLSLFAKDIIDSKTLVDRAEIFLGDGELMAQFKDLMGWDDKQGNVEYGPPGSIRTSAPDYYSTPAPNDGLGPRNYARLLRGNRLCWSVLNDEWISHPTWASEESGFLAHKKNSFEDTLHKSEEERHEYQVHIDALNRTIAVLEPLNNRLDQMSPEERAQFRLKPDLGGTSRTIYERIIKKVYGRDAGMEILKALQESPSVAVPVVLMRLKQRDEEWRRLQREWNRTWREVDAKNFYKALDHQGITFKQNDKKNITAKHFVQDIEAVKAEQAKAREANGESSVRSGSLGHQLEYEFQDTAVLHDAIKLIFSFLDHSPTQYSHLERRGSSDSCDRLSPFCSCSPNEFNAACGPSEVGHEEDMVDDATGSVDEENSKTARDRSARRATHSTGVSARDLRKRLLMTAQEKSPHGESKEASSRSARSTSPAASDRKSQRARERRRGPTYAQALLRGHDVLHPVATAAGGLLYSRLLICKETGAKMAAEKHASLLANPVAVELGLDEPNGPSVILQQAMEAVGERRPGEEPNVLYMYLLDACEKVFENELDQATFEEHMRWFFRTKAYNVYTLDRVIIAIIKQVQTILADNKCQELWYLLQKARSAETTTAHDTIRYRREAERHVGSDDNLYRFDWVRWAIEDTSDAVDWCGDPSVEEDSTAIGRWREYVATYAMVHPTEWMQGGKSCGAVFLRRCVMDATESVIEENSMGMLVDGISYKLLYEAGKEDVLWRRRRREETVVLRGRAVVQEEERRRRLGRMWGITASSLLAVPTLAKPFSSPSPFSRSLSGLALARAWRYPIPNRGMAHPKPFPHSSSVATGSIPTSTSQSQHSKPRTIPRSRKPYSSPIPQPSSGLLALLVTLASSATVRTPERNLVVIYDNQEQDIYPALQARSERRSRTRRSIGIADKYEQGPDGLWRKVYNWSLYGSTICGCVRSDLSRGARRPSLLICSSNRCSHRCRRRCVNKPPPQSGSATSTATATDILPSGWEKSSKNDSVLTAVILSMSIVLALFIGFTISLCVLWRKKRRRALDKDLEKKASSAGDEFAAEELVGTKRARTQQRVWEKASARWKANVRQSVRRRRKRQPAAQRDGETRSLVEEHLSSPPLPSRSHVDDPPATIEDNASSTIQTGPSRTATPVERAMDTATLSQPPAYLSNSASSTGKGRGELHRLRFTETADSQISANTYLGPSVGEPSTHEDGCFPYIDSAHVATDDKAVLARMATLASAPFPADGPVAGGSSEAYASVPPLEDEYEELPPDSEVFGGEGSASRNMRPFTSLDDPLSVHPDCQDVPSYSHDISLHPPILPLPPAKSRMAAPLFYEYPSSFEEDIIGLEPEAGPSAPPFEDPSLPVPSAPPLECDSDDSAALPSAPPLDDNYLDRNPVDGVEISASYAEGSVSASAPQPEYAPRSSPDCSSSSSSDSALPPPRYLP
ncbi:Paired amphipathic helix protein pst1 [Grifola frondosa]|uniref:Paired amphipathic helix protein pst1 n=1 Tax=Grifola frondosa TaxID=5627 RepID=A0A1C7LWC9_GRIFR|nr:Paired amphipathic helix protein pst1 [Grifola frondosa]